MCGRARSGYRADQIRNIVRMNQELQATHPAAVFSKIENFCPGRRNAVAIQKTASIESRDLALMTWGLIPRFMPKNQKLDHFFMFNCRVETITEKRSFKSLLEHGKRCVVVHNGFYEWTMEAKEKCPYYIYDPAERPMLFAGLFDDFETADGINMQTYTILTSPSCSKMRFLHHRQPIRLMTDEEVDIWLNPTSDFASQILPLVNSWSEESSYESMSDNYAMHPVTPKINTLRYQGDDCTAEIKKVSIASFFKSPTKQKDFVSLSPKDCDTDKSDHSAGIAIIRNLNAEKLNFETIECDEQLPSTPPPHSTDSFIESHETYSCPMCCCNLSKFSLGERSEHVEKCISAGATSDNYPNEGKKRKSNDSSLSLRFVKDEKAIIHSPKKSKAISPRKLPSSNCITNYFQAKK